MKHNRQLMAKGLQLDFWGQSKSFLLQLCSVLDTEVTTFLLSSHHLLLPRYLLVHLDCR